MILDGPYPIINAVSNSVASAVITATPLTGLFGCAGVIVCLTDAAGGTKVTLLATTVEARALGATGFQTSQPNAMGYRESTGLTANYVRSTDGGLVHGIWANANTSTSAYPAYVLFGLDGLRLSYQRDATTNNIILTANAWKVWNDDRITRNITRDASGVPVP